MKQIFSIVLALALAAGAVQSQELSAETEGQMEQVAGWAGEPFAACSDQLAQWGFEYNEKGTLNMYAMLMHPFYRAEGDDTIGVILGVVDGVVYSTSWKYISREPARAYALTGQAAAMQQRRAEELGMAKFICSVKGKVSNKLPKSAEELGQVLSEAEAGAVARVYATWRSADGRKTLSLTYDDKVTGKKTLKARDLVELSVGVGLTPKR